MSLEARPFAGTWRLNNRAVIKHSPDCLVYVNGELSLPGCADCGGRIDLQRFITQVSVDNSVEPNPGTCSISMMVPKHEGETVFRDGNFLLHPGLEVHVYMRGYFPVKGVYDSLSPEDTGNLNLDGSVSYPYYQVFHGVVTEVQHGYNAGEHTASLTCSDMLHFWSYHRMSQSAAILARAPSNSKLKTTLIGNNFSGMNGYAIVWQLFTDTMGAAGGADFALSNVTNASAKSETLSKSLWHSTLLYWEKRFNQTLTSLRMYGTNGRLFNAFEQALLKDFKSLDTQRLRAINAADTTLKTQEKNPFSRQLLAARALGFQPDVFYADFASENDIVKARNPKKQFGINAAHMAAFAMDVSAFGSVNLFESTYMTKLEIIQKVCEVTGYEFYVDCDGDFVFKPPFYNLDTSPSRIYRIEPIDVISFDTTEREPECTALKGTGGHFQNMTGLGLESNEWGTRAEYIDYKLVAKFGWRPQTFETSYFVDPRAMFYSAIARMDVYNIQVNSASCAIPYRPELRVGHPVYVSHLDCYYYIQSLSHSFTFGGQAVTNLTLVGKRAKFFAPGVPREDGVKASVGDIKLNNMYLPSLPLQARTKDSGIPRMVGFPNVVLAIDPTLVNPLGFVVNSGGLEKITSVDDAKQLVMAARLTGVLNLKEQADDPQQTDRQWLEGPYILSTGDGEPIEIPSVQRIVQQGQNLARLSVSNDNVDQQRKELLETEGAEGARELYLLMEATRNALDNLFPGAGTAANYLSLVNNTKANFAPGKDVPGYYRYYSASHPDPSQQGQLKLEQVERGEEAAERGIARPGALARLEHPIQVQGFQDVTNGGGVQFVDVDVVAGLNIVQPGVFNETTNRFEPPAPRSTPTNEIQTVSFVEHSAQKQITVPKRQGGRNAKFPSEQIRPGLYSIFWDETYKIDAGELWSENPVKDVYSQKRQLLLAEGTKLNLTSPSPAGFIPSYDSVLAVTLTDRVLADAAGEDPRRFIAVDPLDQAITWANILASEMARGASLMFKEAQRQLEEEFGALNRDASSSNLEETKTARFESLFSSWSSLVINILGLNYNYRGKSNNAGGNLGVIRNIRKTVTKKYHSLVLPVSDSSGYEVIGGYRYGRGMSIEPGGSFETLQKNTPFSQKDFSAVEAFVKGLTSKSVRGDIIRAFSSENISDEAKEAALRGIAEGLITIDEKTQKELVLKARSGELGDRFKTGFSNTIATQRKAPDKVTVVNAAYNLADIGNRVRNTVCSCKGSEADVLLSAYSAGQQFENVIVQPDEISAWVSGQMTQIGTVWRQQREALRGEVLDHTAERAAQAFERTKGSLDQNRSQARQIQEEAGGLDDLEL